MHHIQLNPQVGINIKGIGQANFGMTRAEVVKIFGPYNAVNKETDKRVEYTQYGFFADFKKDDDTFEAVEFWNDREKNASAVYILGQEVLLGDPQAILSMLTVENSNEAPNDGWFVNIDVIYSGGNLKQILAMIEQAKTNGTFADEKDYLLNELESQKHFMSFGIGYKGYCKDGLAELARLLNASN
jgi:hypothetical protein